MPIYEQAEFQELKSEILIKTDGIFLWVTYYWKNSVLIMIMELLLQN